MVYSEDSALLRDSILFTVISVAISQLALGELLFCIPLLFLSYRFRDARKAVIPFAVSLVFTLGITLFRNKALFAPGLYGRLVMSVMYSFSVVAGSVVWVLIRDKSSVVLRKLVLSTIPSFAVALCFALYLTFDSQKNELEGIRQLFEASFPAQLAGVFDIKLLSQLCVSVLLTMSAPIGMIITIVPLLASDCAVHSHDTQYQDDFANMALPPFLVWPFMGLWILSLLGNVALKYPPFLSVLFLNTTFALTLYYMLSGVSVLLFKLRRRNPSVKAGAILLYLVLFSFLPGLNLAVVVGLSVTGVLGTWLDMRK